MLVGGIEAGGTKFICAVGSGPDDLEISQPIPTRSPEETMRDVVAFFQGRKLKRMGIGSFGPISHQHGTISRTTPKLDWRGVPIKSIVEKELKVKVTFDTDVNAAALSEYRWGAAVGCDNFVYITVGTGIGGGAIVNGKLIQGLSHPEMGHIRVPRVKTDRFPGVCPLHGDCLEGMASGPAISKGSKFAARYLAWGMMNLTGILSPKMIVLGGGVMKTPGLLKEIRIHLKEELCGYVPMPKLVRPGLKDSAGVLGAIALAQDK